MKISGAYPLKRMLVIASFAAVLLVLAVGTVWLYSKNGNTQQANQQAMQTAATTKKAMVETADRADAATSMAPNVSPVAGTSTSAPGTYQDYDNAALVNAGNRSRVLFFHAPWCPQCRKLDADIKAKGVPDGIAVFKVDYDSNQSLRQQYEVTIQTTVVQVDADGRKIKSFLPYSEPSLANTLSGLGL